MDLREGRDGGLLSRLIGVDHYSVTGQSHDGIDAKWLQDIQILPRVAVVRTDETVIFHETVVRTGNDIVGKTILPLVDEEVTNEGC